MISKPILIKNSASNSNYFGLAIMAFSLLFLVSCQSGKSKIQQFNTTDNPDIAMVKADYSKKG